MMKALTLLTSILALSGCVYQTVDYLDLEAATRACKDRGGVKIISESFLASTNVKCFDKGAIISVDTLSSEIENERNRHD